MDDNELIHESQKHEQQTREWVSYRMFAVLVFLLLGFVTWQGASCDHSLGRRAQERIDTCEKRLHEAYAGPKASLPVEQR